IFGLKHAAGGEDRLPSASLENICEQLAIAGFKLCAGDGSIKRLRELRGMYEPEAFQLGRLLMQELPPFYPEPGKRSNWTQITGLRSQTEASLLSADQRKTLAVNDAAVDDSHSF
ncbi:MAG TPA: hypothetical protein VFN62_11180, partial [Acidobacteriaceae bacterium]|nr:hypothetical protein [Acidobacteriaceae bacterium]